MSSPYEKIEVKDQVQLTTKETFSFCISSIKHRFFRSLLTLAVVVLAVAFFMYLLTDNIFTSSVKKGVIRELNHVRRGSKLLNLMYTKPSLNGFTYMIASLSDDDVKRSLLKGALKISEKELDHLESIAENQRIYDGFFKNIKIGQRKVLVGRRSGDNIYKYLKSPENLKGFKNRLEPMGSIKIPGGYTPFDQFIADFSEYDSKRRKLFELWNLNIDSLKRNSEELSNGKTIRSFISSASDKQLESWKKIISNHGFNLSDNDYKAIYDKIKSELLRDEVVTYINSPEIRMKWRSMFSGGKNKTGEKLDLLDSGKVLDLLNKKFSTEQLIRVAEDYRYDTLLRNLEERLEIGSKPTVGALISGKKVYLLVLSFVVCMVGIANAMLMSITERFREIATLKCLGATDSFILTQIIIEAALQGFAGGAIGVLVGLLITILKSTILYGIRLFLFFPFSGVAVAIVVSLVAGILLSILASIYPSLKAARMAPMEAMRIE